MEMKLLYRPIPIIETRVLEKNLQRAIQGNNIFWKYWAKKVTDINLISSDSNWIEANFKTILFLNDFINITDDTVKRGRTDIELFANILLASSFIEEDKF